MQDVVAGSGDDHGGATATREERRSLRRRRTDRLLAFVDALFSSDYASLDHEATLARAAELAVPDLGDWCVVDVLDSDGDLRPVTIAGTEGGALGDLRRELHPVDDLLTVLRSGKVTVAERAEPSPGDHGTGSFRDDRRSSWAGGPAMIVPIAVRGRTFGVVTFATADPARSYSGEDLELAEQFAARCAVAAESALLAAEQAELAQTDALTGVGNRRALEEALYAEVARTNRARSPLSVLVVDVDGFKAINDQRGHLAGDDCLRTLADVLLHTVRAADRCFRWGGDEFVVILPDTPLVSAERVTHRLKERTGGLGADRCGFTVSCGLAELRGGQTPDDLLSAADLSMLVAKTEAAEGR